MLICVTHLYYINLQIILLGHYMWLTWKKHKWSTTVLLAEITIWKDLEGTVIVKKKRKKRKDLALND